MHTVYYNAKFFTAHMQENVFISLDAFLQSLFYLSLRIVDTRHAKFVLKMCLNADLLHSVVVRYYSHM